MKRKMRTKALSLLLCAVMLVGLLPITAAASGSDPITTDKVYTYEKIDSVDDIIPGKHFIIVAEYINDTTGEISYHALGAKMSYYDGFRLAYKQDSDDYYGIGKSFEISDDKNTITTYYNDTNYSHDYTNDYYTNEPEHGILRLRFEAYDLSKNQYRFGVDGHGYMYGFSSRGNDGTAGHPLHAKMPIGTYTSGASWWQLSVGENGYWQICTQTTYGSWDGSVTGYERIQSYIYPHHGIAATSVYGGGIELLPEGNTGILLYMETECNHYPDTVTYQEGKQASCDAPGTREYWYCSDCESYYSNEEMTDKLRVNDIFIAPTPHTDSCSHAEETLKFELCTDPPGSSSRSGERYLLVGKAGDQYYTMGNVTNPDGSRNAVEVTLDANGIISSSSHQSEFLTYYWPDSGPTGYLADNGYLSALDGEILAYDQTLYNSSKFIPNPVRYSISDYDTGLGSFYAYSSYNRGNEYIVFDADDLCFRSQSTESDSTYLYRELCPHEKEYTAAIDATCTRCGNVEYWYCNTCWKYFGAADGSITLDERQLNAHAFGHNYVNGVCEHCGKTVPVYTKVTSEDQFGLSGTYIIVATDGTNTYVLKQPSNMWADLDNNGMPDIEELDEDGNGIPDCYEKDSDGDGEPDIYDYDYVEPLVIPVTPNSDGSISVSGLNAAEFEMVTTEFGDNGYIEAFTVGDLDITPTSSDMYYLWMPNGLLNGQNSPNTRFACYINGEGLQGADETCAWGISLGSNLSDQEQQELANAQFTVNSDTAIMYAENCGNGATCPLRLREYNGVLSFVTDYDSWLPGATEKVDENGDFVTDEYGNILYDTNDTQYGVFLYFAPDEYSHIHQWSDWETVDENSHRRTCSADGCTVGTETKPHRWDDGTVTKAPTCTEAGVTTYTCTDCGAVKTEEISALDHLWGDWTDDGDIHTRLCQRSDCTAAQREAHAWSDWAPDGDSGHTKSCPVCSGIRTEPHQWDDGVITTQPTEDAEGVMTYTCSHCDHIRTESIDKLEHVHVWSDWTENDDGATHTRECPCGESETLAHAFDAGTVTVEATHTSVGVKTFTCTDCGYTYTEEIPLLTEHQWSDWAENDDGATHTRECPCGESETLAHAWSDWTQQAAGGYLRECAHCGAAQRFTPDEETSVNTTPTDNSANAALENTDAELMDKVLTNEDLSQAAEGADVKIYLIVEDISDQVSADDRAEAEAAAGDDEIGMYLDINLFKQIGTSETQITETAGAVTITITIPEHLINTDESVTRTYKIIRVHEDENGDLITDVIEGVYDPEDHSFTFQSDKFSTYALTYSDTQTSSNRPGGPQTGDSNMMWLWLAVVCIGAAGLIAAVVYGKKRSF